MVRLMLVLAPVMCLLAGIGISGVLGSFMKNLESTQSKKSKASAGKKFDQNYPYKNEVRYLKGGYNLMLRRGGGAEERKFWFKNKYKS